MHVALVTGEAFETAAVHTVPTPWGARVVLNTILSYSDTLILKGVHLAAEYKTQNMSQLCIHGWPGICC